MRSEINATSKVKPITEPFSRQGTSSMSRSELCLCGLQPVVMHGSRRFSESERD